jgi:hypothetical protein
VESILKKSILALCALTLAAGLSACGGGSSNYTIGGTVYGLEYGPLVLTTNGMEVAVQPAKDANGKLVTTYAFPQQLEYGTAYNVVLKQTGTDASGAPIYQQPPHQVCGVTQNSRTSDTAGRLATIDASFTCALASHTVGGTISGLAADGLVLTNGSTGGTVAVAKDATSGAYPTSFVFSTPVTYKQTYGVTVLYQPAGQTCTVANGAGTMEDVAVTSIGITCANNPA